MLARNEDDLCLALIRLARQYGRYGYRKVGELLRMEGWVINHKRVERIWREEGLQLPPHHALGMRPPVPETSLVKASISGTEHGG